MDDLFRETKDFIKNYKPSNKDQLEHHREKVSSKLLEITKQLSELVKLNNDLLELENTKHLKVQEQTTPLVPIKEGTSVTDYAKETKNIPEKLPSPLNFPIDVQKPKEVAPGEKKVSSKGLENFFAPMGLDEIMTSQEPIPQQQTAPVTKFSSFDKALNLKEEMITFDQKSEKTTKILHLFENVEQPKKEEKKSELKLDDLF